MQTTEERYRGRIDKAAVALGAWLISVRVPLLILFVTTTVILGYFAAQIRLEAGFSKSIPNNHPYMQVYREYAPAFGGGNVLTMALMSKDGDIFTPEFMKALEQLTDDVNAMPGIDQATTMSLFSPSAILINVDETGFTGFRIVPADFKPTEEGIAQVRANLLRSGEIGRLVSRDLSGALLFTELIERPGEPIDYALLGERLEKLQANYTTESVDLHVIGFAKFISDVIEGAQAVVLFFFIAFVMTAILLYLYTNSGWLTVASLAIALSAVVWGLGLVKLFGYGIDPLSILVPFLVFSIAVSHAVQMASAWRVAVSEGVDSGSASRIAFEKVFIPGATALLTTGVSFAVLIVIDIPIIHELAVIASIGMAVMIVTNKFFFPLLLYYIRPNARGLQRMEGRARFLADLGLWRSLSRFSTRRLALGTLVVAGLVMGYGIYERQWLIVGDTGVGAPELREGSRYNRDVRVIQRNFAFNTDELVVVAEVPDTGCVDFRNVYWVDRFHGYMAQQPKVAGVNSLAKEIRVRYMGNNEGHPAFFDIPRSPYNISAGLARLELGQRLFNADCTAIPIRVFAEDHNAETLAELVASVETFKAEAGKSVDFQLAAGSAGVMVATNEAVEDARLEMMLMLYVAVAVLCYVTFLSWRVSLCVLIPLMLVSQFAEAVMAWLGIGLKVSTLPVLALGAGVGVDYGIYLFSRTQSALRDGLPLREAYLESLRSAGTAVVFTALTMTVGVATWVFSPLKFQADMGMLLAYMFFVNMVGAVVVLPALAAWIVGRSGPGDLNRPTTASVSDCVAK